MNPPKTADSVLSKISKVNAMVKEQAADADVQNVTPVFAESVRLAERAATWQEAILILGGLAAHFQQWADALVRPVRIPADIDVGIGEVGTAVEDLVKSPRLDRWAKQVMLELCTIDSAFDEVARTGPAMEGDSKEKSLGEIIVEMIREHFRAKEAAERHFNEGVREAFKEVIDAASSESAEQTDKGGGNEGRGERPVDPRSLNDAPRGLIDGVKGIARLDSSFTYATRPERHRIHRNFAGALANGLNNLRRLA